MNHILGDILEVPAGSVIFHQANTAGVMGAGLAKLIRQKFPECCAVYLQACRSGAAKLGDWFSAKSSSGVWVVHLVGQETFGRTGVHTHYGALAKALFSAVHAFEGSSCYFPYRLGCGLGGGDWVVVRAILEHCYPEGTIIELR